jgi:hypothetical protein
MQGAVPDDTDVSMPGKDDEMARGPQERGRVGLQRRPFHPNLGVRRVLQSLLDRRADHDRRLLL